MSGPRQVCNTATLNASRKPETKLVGMSFAFFLAFIVCVSLTSEVEGVGLKCEKHPLFKPGLKSVLVRSWVFPQGRSEASVYHPRYDKHLYVPVKDETSRKWAKMDWFWAFPGTGSSKVYVRLQLQRRAKVFLVVKHAFNPAFPAVSLTGWSSEGYALLEGGPGQKQVYGVHQQNEWGLWYRAHIFSRVFNGGADLPGRKWVRANIKGVSSDGSYFAMISEADGSASRPPRNPKGIIGIKPNTRCPDKLHDAWVTKSDDNADSDTRGRFWKTWHPAWDPCYWCAYDHEHGASPEAFGGLPPKYAYVAWKNGRESESNQGFKTYVFRSGPYLVTFFFHAQTSSLRRVSVKMHTISFTITHSKTKQKLVEISHKGDFGFLSARAKGGLFIPLSAADKTEAEKQKKPTAATQRRSINVMNPKQNEPFSTRDIPVLRSLGVYEDWTSSPICSSGRRGAGEFNADFFTPITGIFSTSRKTAMVSLGARRGRHFIRSDGAGRRVKFQDLVIGEDECKFRNGKTPRESSKNGVFYTSPDGGTLLPGPGRNAVRQYIRPGFKITLHGRYEPVDSWVGMHVKDHQGQMFNYGFGLNPDVN